MRQAGNAPKNRAERTAQNVRGFAGSEVNGFARFERKAQRRKAKEQALFYDQLQRAN